jgi:NADH:ubiquinone oxidoreductase subunit E
MKEQIEDILKTHEGAKTDSLIPILQEIQAGVGYLSEESIIRVGKNLSIPTSRIYGVATFYNQFRFEPAGKYNFLVCRGTACHVLGSATVLETLEKELKIKAGQTTRNGLFSIEVVACIGACGLAPVICVNGKFYAKVTAESLTKIIHEYKETNG